MGKISLSDNHQIIKCNYCSANLRIPKHHGLIDVTCPKCKYVFRVDTGLKTGSNHSSTKNSKSTVTSDNAKSTKEHKSATSYRSQGGTSKSYTQMSNKTIAIYRLTHEYKGLSFQGAANAVKDARKVKIYLDGIEQGLLNNEQPMILKIDNSQHTIGLSSRSKGYILPAGNDSYVALFFNGGFRIGPVEDTFRDSLTQYVLNMVRGQGFRERIQHSNNLNHAVKVSICQDCIWVHWQLAQTKGFKEWATGEKSEKIYYSKIGLIPIAESRQPDGYWEYIENYVHESILKDSKADLQYSAGGFTFRTEHEL